MNQQPDWEWEIKPENKWYKLNLTEVFTHRDLIITFFRRELLSGYHQTVIGIFWIVLQPILTTLFYFIVFSGIVKVSTEGIPPVLFFMSGNILWSFFSDCLTGTMYSFLFNAHIYNKVYFPRLVMPLSTLLNHSVRFGIQFVLFIIVYAGYSIFSLHIIPSTNIVFLPLLFISLAAFSLGLGLMLSVWVARYRDIEHMMNFLLRLLMFITPVVYPASLVPQKFRLLFCLNPVTPVIETFRNIFFNTGQIEAKYICISLFTSIATLLLGIIFFKKGEIKVMDNI